MAGQLAVTARKSIPVENRSSRLFSAAGVGALVIATSQWAHWMGYADWDLLSLIPGFAQVTGLLPNAYADGSNFDCPNKTLGSEIALMSDDMLKTVGKTLCTKEELIAASLRAGDGQARRRALALAAAQPSEILILPILPLTRAPLQPPHIVQAPMTQPVTEPAIRPFTLASLAPVHSETNKDLIDEITLRARRVDSVDPCSGGLATKSSAGCEVEHPPVDDTHSGGGSSGPGGGTGGGPGGGPGGSSDGGHDVTEIDYGDHSGPGDGSSGSGDGGGSGDGSHSGGDHSGEDGHSDGGSHDGGTSHDGHADYTDNSDSHSGGETSHDSGSDASSHDKVETVDRSSDTAAEDSHASASAAEETHGSSSVETETHSSGSADSGSHGGSDGESSHGGGSGSGSDGGGHGSSGSHG